MLAPPKALSTMRKRGFFARSTASSDQPAWAKVPLAAAPASPAMELRRRDRLVNLMDMVILTRWDQ
jgi:hypothetical protein